MYRIDVYFMENIITTSKFYIIQILPGENVVIQTKIIEEAEKLREKDGWIKIMRSKAKLT